MNGQPTYASSSAKPVGGVTFETASAALMKQFDAVTKSVGTIASASTVQSVVLAGRPAGGVARYTVSAAMAKSAQFQNQFLVQLLSALGDSSPTFVWISGKLVAVSQGKSSAAGWFDGTRAVVLLRQGSTPALESLAASTIAHPGG